MAAQSNFKSNVARSRLLGTVADGQVMICHLVAHAEHAIY